MNVLAARNLEGRSGLLIGVPGGCGPVDQLTGLPSR